MRILVTGGTGFIGSALTRRLVELGHEVWITGIPTLEDVPAGVHVFAHGPCGIDWFRMARMTEKGGKIDVLFHQAANNDTTCDDDQEMEFANVHTSIDIFNRVANLGCRKMIYASSTAVYGDAPVPHLEDGEVRPLNAYAKSKLLLEAAAEIFARQNDSFCIGLRYCNVYGPGEWRKGKRASMIYQMAVALGRRPVKLFERGEQARDYVFVDDVVRANILAMELNVTDVFNVGSGVATTFNELYQIISQHKRHSWKGPEYIPNPHKGKYQDYTLCDMKKSERVLGFRCKYDINTGIKEYFDRGGFR